MKKIFLLLLFVSNLCLAQQKIFASFDNRTQPIVEGASKSFGIAIGVNAPSSDVTALFSSTNGYFSVTSSLTFTSSNFATPQAITLTGTSDGNVEGLKTDYLTISLSGGGYSGITKVIPIKVTDSGLDENFIKGWNWMRYVNISTSGDLVTKKAALINYVFNGNGLPTDAIPDVIETSWSGSIFNDTNAGFVGETTITRLTWILNDVDGFPWTNRAYHFVVSGATKCVLVNRGHGSESYSVTLINELIADGFSVIYCGMPQTLSDNIEANPNVTGTGVSGHNGIATSGLDRVGYCPLELFFFDKIQSLNYLDANFSYDEYYATGASGGGFTTTMLQAMDSRITRAVHVRGSKPPHVGYGYSDESLATNRDYEQYAGNTTSGARQEAFFLNTVTFFDLYLLAGSGGRINHHSFHAADNCCHNKFTFNLWSSYIDNLASTLGCGFDLSLNTDPSYVNHGWNVNDRTIISTEF